MFGVYEDFYQLEYIPHHTPSSIAWIGTVQGYLLITVGVISGPLYDLGYLRTMLICGCTLCVLALMMLSLATKYYQIFLSQGVCLGLGSGLLYVPSLALVASSFTKKRALANGIISSGIATGESERDLPQSRIPS